ncbi:MAG: hypothetical protein SPK79_01315 [Erysipelotrichaceae bacterium]|nr:hypothetical protein [Erysipelotrichaceae bacterium]
MLPDKNELNDELAGQISGGEEFQDFHDGTVLFHGYTVGASDLKQTEELCPNCESVPLETSIPVGDIKTTVPDLSN